MNQNQAKSNFKTLMIDILLYLMIFVGFIFLFASFMNRMTLIDYKERGKTISSTLDEISTYKVRTSKKGPESTKLMVKVDFNLKGLSGTTYLTEFISESDMDEFKDGERIDLIYIPGSEYLANGKASFVKDPILKPILEKALNRNIMYLWSGGILFILGVVLLILKKKFFKP